jgi:hypothetical protein
MSRQPWTQDEVLGLCLLLLLVLMVAALVLLWVTSGQ